MIVTTRTAFDGHLLVSYGVRILSTLYPAARTSSHLRKHELLATEALGLGYSNYSGGVDERRRWWTSLAASRQHVIASLA